MAPEYQPQIFYTQTGSFTANLCSLQPEFLILQEQETLEALTEGSWAGANSLVVLWQPATTAIARNAAKGKPPDRMAESSPGNLTITKLCN